MNEQKQRAQRLRASQTKSDGLLWSILRAKQLCGLKFRRQHPIGPFFADFACINKKLVIEVDGGYHDLVAKSDLERESYIREKSWEILRFSDEEVEDDAEVVARGIAKPLGLEYRFEKRKSSGSGMLAPKPSPQSDASDCDPPKEAVILFINRLQTVAASVPDAEKSRLLRGVSLGQTDLHQKFTTSKGG